MPHRSASAIPNQPALTLLSTLPGRLQFGRSRGRDSLAGAGLATHDDKTPAVTSSIEASNPGCLRSTSSKARRRFISIEAFSKNPTDKAVRCCLILEHRKERFNKIELMTTCFLAERKQTKSFRHRMQLRSRNSANRRRNDLKNDVVLSAKRGRT